MLSLPTGVFRLLSRALFFRELFFAKCEKTILSITCKVSVDCKQTTSCLYRVLVSSDVKKYDKGDAAFTIIAKKGSDKMANNRNYEYTGLCCSLLHAETP